MSRAVLLICLAASGVAGNAQAQEGIISGRISAQGNGLPLAGVTVRLDGDEQSWSSDSRGAFEIAGVSPGPHTLTASRVGYEAWEASVTVVAGETARVTITLAETPTAPAETPFQLNEMVVTATRAPTAISAVPASVSVLGGENLLNQTTLSRNLFDVLAKSVPGLGMSRETEYQFGSPLRGRKMLVLLDGVSLDASLRVGAENELTRIHPRNIERIEVIRGPSSLYGSGASGGIINIITKRGVGGRPAFVTSVGTSFSTAQFSGSVAKRVAQQISGSASSLDYFVSGSYSNTGSTFDAQGDRVPTIGVGGPVTESFDVQGKLGLDLTPGSRLQFSAQIYRSHKTDSYAPVDAVVGQRKAEAVKVPAASLDPEDAAITADLPAPANDQEHFQVDYTNSEVFGSEVSAKAYYTHFFRRNAYDPGFFQGSLLNDFPKSGVRITVRTPLPGLTDAALHWGGDATRYIHDEKLESPAGTTEQVVPYMDQKSFAGFVQALVVIGPVSLSGGIRYEDFGVDVRDFTTHSAFGSTPVQGGRIDYEATTYNAGAVLGATEEVQLFASLSQGFSLTEIGRVLWSTDIPRSAVDQRPEPQIVDSYEGGIRGSWERAQFTASVFRSESELGTTFFVDPVTNLSSVIRAPERIWGVELTVDARPHAAWQVGGSVTTQSGEHDPDRDGVYEPLPSFRISPAKVTGYLSHSGLRALSSRLQFTYGGERDEFPGSVTYGQGKVESVFLVDLIGTVRIRSGSLRFGVQNLLNKFYIPQPNQGFNSARNYLAGQGRTITLDLVVPWRL